MVFCAYIIPIIACILLYFEFDYSGEWTTYMWIIIFGEVTAGLTHFFFFNLTTSCKEYLGSIIESIHYEEPWIELIEKKETKTDSNGRSYTVTYIEEKFHDEKYYFITTLNKHKDTVRAFYNFVRDTWNLPGHKVCWTGRSIKGGERYGKEYKFDDFDLESSENPENWIPVTEVSSYTNKIRCSNSIFKFENIDKSQAEELGLYEYPEVYNYDAQCILSRSFDVDEEILRLFRKFNGRIAPQAQMRLYILLFEAEKEIGIAEMQRMYWQGGNKNEFVICIGLNKDNKIEWARAFSWADEQNLEIETSQWLMKHPDLDWCELYNWLSANIMRWKRKEFSDFNYIHVTLPLWQIILILLLSVGENVLALYIALN